MGRHAKVPVTTAHGNKIVNAEKVSLSANTPYHPNDVRWDVLHRIGHGGIPDFANQTPEDNS